MDIAFMADHGNIVFTRVIVTQSTCESWVCNLCSFNLKGRGKNMEIKNPNGKYSWHLKRINGALFK